MKEMIKNQNDEDITQKVTEESIEETAKKVVGAARIARGISFISIVECFFFSIAFIFFSRNEFFFYGTILALILFVFFAVVSATLMDVSEAHTNDQSCRQHTHENDI